ncbi:MAG: peptidylprolyl isomerase [Rhodospirillales bacterium]|nr:peptidylprolyl isomerase [Rhodospirillales bacterium]
MFDFRVRVAVLMVFTGLVFPAHQSFAAGHNPDPVAAIVNGMKIYRSEIEAARVRLPEQFRSAPFENVYLILLNGVIDTKLAALRARSEKLHEDQKVKAQIASVEDQILEGALIQKHLRENISQEALQKRYQQAIKSTEAKELVRARHILLENEGQAKKVIEELNAGADFATLAKTKSTGPSASRGGDLGYFAEGEMVPEFSKSAFSLKPGTHTMAPVKTQFGWHVIKVEDRKPAQPKSFQDMENSLREEESRALVSALVKSMRQKAAITRYNLDGTAMKAEK